MIQGLQMELSEFFKSDYVDFASYSTIRMIASAIDGQKNASRKVIATVFNKNITNEMKVSQLASKVAETTEYLHGDVSLQGVIVTMAQNYVGANNIPLLDREGNFGNRFINEASAPRYIYTNGSKELFTLIKKDDNAILEKQYFEGGEIEPRFYLPTLPLILVNGAEGIASGFAQKILPRNPKEIEKYIKYRLSHPDSPKKPFKNKPYFEGFKGSVEQGETNNQWIIKGVFNKLSSTKVEITEVPIGYTLKGYMKVLDKLEDEGVITRYEDKCENDVFHFIVHFKRNELAKLTDDKLLDKLKLKKSLTENYTTIDIHNRVKVFNNISEIMDYFIEVKLLYLKKRKIYMMEQLTNDIKLDVSRYVFIDSVIKGKIVVQNREEKDVIADIEKADKIIKKDDSYEYLLNMPVRSMTSTKLKVLYDKIKSTKNVLTDLKETSIEQIWLKEI
jgi:DNA topoisomerase-2